MTARRGKPAKGLPGLCLLEEERDRLPERIVNKVCRAAWLVARYGGRGWT